MKSLKAKCTPISSSTNASCSILKPIDNADIMTNIDDINEHVVDTKIINKKRLFQKRKNSIDSDSKSITSDSENNKQLSMSDDAIDNVVIIKSNNNNNSHNDTGSSTGESGLGTVGDGEIGSIQSGCDNNSIKDQHIDSTIHQQQPQSQQQLQVTSQQDQQQILQSPSEKKVQQQSQQQQQQHFTPRNSTAYETHDDNLVILSNSVNSSMFSTSSSATHRHSLLARYLCCCCTCCKTTNTIFWSWLSIFCCCCPLLGGISLYFTHKSKRCKLKQQYELSDKYSSYAEKLNIASLIFGVLFYAFLVFVFTLVIFMYWRHSYA